MIRSSRNAYAEAPCVERYIWRFFIKLPTYNFVPRLQIYWHQSESEEALLAVGKQKHTAGQSSRN